MGCYRFASGVTLMSRTAAGVRLTFAVLGVHQRHLPAWLPGCCGVLAWGDCFQSVMHHGLASYAASSGTTTPLPHLTPPRPCMITSINILNHKPIKGNGVLFQVLVASFRLICEIGHSP